MLPSTPQYQGRAAVYLGKVRSAGLWTNALLLLGQVFIVLAACAGGALPPAGGREVQYIFLPIALVVSLATWLQPTGSPGRHLAAAGLGYWACELASLSGGDLELRAAVLILLSLLRDSGVLVTVAGVYFFEAATGAPTLSWSIPQVLALAGGVGLVWWSNQQFFQLVKQVARSGAERGRTMQTSLAHQNVEQELEKTHLEMMLSGVEAAGAQTAHIIAEMSTLLRDQERRMLEQGTGMARVAALGRQTESNVHQLQGLLRDLGARNDVVAQAGRAGGDRLEELQHLFQRITAEAAQISSDFLGSSQQAAEISQIAQIIEKVTRQTRLLSLNAAVEAEKAGELGRGFGALAQEIRRLAQQTELFLDDMQALLREIQVAVTAGASGVEQFVEEVGRTAQTTEAVTAQMDRVVGEVRAVEPLFLETRHTLNLQLESVLGISNRIKEVDITNGLISQRVQDFGRGISELEVANYRLITMATASAQPEKFGALTSSEPALPAAAAFAARTQFHDSLHRYHSSSGLILLVAGAAQALGGLSQGLSHGSWWLGATLLAAGALAWAGGGSRWACALAAAALPWLSHQLATPDLSLLNLSLVGLSRESLGGCLFLLSAVLSSPGQSGMAYLLVASHLLLFWGAVGWITRRRMWGAALEEASLEQLQKLSHQRIAEEGMVSTYRLQGLLQGVRDFSSTVTTSGQDIHESGQRYEEGSTEVARTTQNILSNSDALLSQCGDSLRILSELQVRTQDSFQVAQQSRTGIDQGQRLLDSIGSAAHLVGTRLQAMLSRLEQVGSLVRSIRKTAERVRVVSLHAAMEAARSGHQHDFNYIAEEIRDLGNRLEISALNVGRILSHIQTRVHANLACLDSFRARLQASLAHLHSVDQTLQGTEFSLNETLKLLGEGTQLVRRQDYELRQMQEAIREMEGRQKLEVTSRGQLQDALRQLSESLAQLKWSTADS